MINKLKKLFDSSSSKIKKTEKTLEAIRELEDEISDMTYTEMADKVKSFKAELKPLVDAVPAEAKRSVVKVNRQEKFPEFEKAIQEKLLDFLPEMYAMMNEIYKRITGSGYHDVQLKAAILLAKGQLLTELYTGEGKTRTFQLPLSLYALVGRGSHLITVNDYLTKVGGEYAGHFMSKLGLTVGIITPEGSFKYINDDEIESFKGIEAKEERDEHTVNIDSMAGLNLVECQKREAYSCDITYGTNNEFGFDYLRDNMAWSLDRQVQRELYFCIIDEADSILIDEARTPLIISATPTESDTEKYTTFANAVQNLEEGEHYEVDYKSRSANLTEDGMNKLEQILEVDNLWDDFASAFHLENALKAKSLFEKDDKYIVKNGNIFIVDEFTGRVLEGRRYSEGLHQAIEAKEGVEIKQENKTFATITFQNFFRLYKVLCGGSGTIMTESEEFYKIYGVDSVQIPTNKPNIRKDLPDRIYKSQEAKFSAVVDEVKEMVEIGRPVLVGTTSVEKSEYLSGLLDNAGIDHEVLNAKFHEQESRIVSRAGSKGAVTVATNMAGRGTDIVIGGGVRGDDSYWEVHELGGLHVIGTERHDARRVDNQLRGRTGRQGEPGSTRFYSSLDDQILKVLGGEFMSRMLGMVNVPDDYPIELGFISKQIEVAQKRVENVNFDSRKNVVEYDDVMNQHREIFYTRRGNIMVNAENALGRFVDGRKVIDLNLPEHKKKEKEFEEKINDAKERMEVLIEDMIFEHLDALVNKYLLEEDLEKKNVEEFLKRISKFIPEKYLVREFAGGSGNPIDKLYRELQDVDEPSRVVNQKLENIFEEKSKELGDDFYNVSKSITLESMDKKWVDHLEFMKDVKNSIRLESYAQRNPLVEYKNRAFTIFGSFISNISADFTEKFFRLTRVNKAELEAAQPRNVQTNEDQVEDVLTGGREMFEGESEDSNIKTDKLLRDIEKSASRTRASLKTNSSTSSNKTKVKTKKEYGRNDRVTVVYANGSKKENVKYKKVMDDVESGDARVV